MIDELKALLRNEENLDERELHYEFEQLTDRYQFEEEYSYIFEGLRILYERLHPIYNRDPYSHLCKKQVFDQQFSEKLISADFGKLVLHIVIDKAVMRQRAAASLLGA